ncbi:MAG: hypothetical protein ACI815_002309, partial [Psychroserpens sp.]
LLYIIVETIGHKKTAIKAVLCPRQPRRFGGTST